MLLSILGITVYTPFYPTRSSEKKNVVEDSYTVVSYTKTENKVSFTTKSRYIEIEILPENNLTKVSYEDTFEKILGIKTVPSTVTITSYDSYSKWDLTTRHITEYAFR